MQSGLKGVVIEIGAGLLERIWIAENMMAILSRILRWNLSSNLTPFANFK
jgi:hypothetical protein